MYVNRQQSLQIAISAIKQLPETPENTQAIERLEGILSDCKITGTYWTKEKVFEALNKWRDEHGRNPSVTNLSEPGMPPSSTIQRLFDMKGSAFLNIYYPRTTRAESKSKYTVKSEQEWIENFVEQFNKIKPSSASDYNAKREKGTPAWATIAKYLNLSTWHELLKKTCVNTHSLKVKNGLEQEPKVYYVDSTCSTYNKLKDLFEKVYKADLNFCEKEKQRTVELYKARTSKSHT